MPSIRELPLPPTPMNAIHKMNQLGSHARWNRGVEEVFASPFHLPANMNGEEGNHCHSSRYSTKPPDCILDSDMPLFFFFLQGNQMFLHSVTDSLPDCPKTSIAPHRLLLHPPPLPHVFKSSSSFVPFSIPASQFASGWISVWSGDCWLNSKSIIAFAKKKYYFHQVISH